MPLRPPLFFRVVGWISLSTWSGVILAGLLLKTQNNSARSAEPKTATAADQTQLDRVSSPLVRTDLRLESAASCAATTCHGGPRPGMAHAAAARGSEYPLWLEHDPHARSWQTFCSQASLAIMQRLGIIESGEIVDAAGYDNCLGCHNSTRQFEEPRAAVQFREGVGCSGCHGPAGEWRSTHYLAHWNANSAVDNGFVPAGNLLARARMCATCHIGDRDRDMNHDMIAAGHPALNYEFTTFHQRLPKHWRDGADGRPTHHEASQWLAGQFASLDASMVLLEARAAGARPVSRWPELSSFECAACHQRLSLPSAGASIALQATTARGSRWNRFGVEELLRLRRDEGKDTPYDRRLAEALARVTLAIQAAADAAEDAKDAARETRLALDAWLTSAAGLAEIQRFTPQRLQALVLSAGKQQPNQESWESAAQFYLAAVAARQAWSDPQPTPAQSTPAQSTPAQPKPRPTAPPSVSWPAPPTTPQSIPRTAQQTAVLAEQTNSAARDLRNALLFVRGTHSPQSTSNPTLQKAWLDFLRTVEHAGSRQSELIPVPEKILLDPRSDRP